MVNPCRDAGLKGRSGCRASSIFRRLTGFPDFLLFMVPAYFFRMLQTAFNGFHFFRGDKLFRFNDINGVLIGFTDADLPLHIAVLITVGYREIMLSVGSEPLDLPTDIFMADITAAAGDFPVG